MPWHKRKPRTKLAGHVKGVDPDCNKELQVDVPTALGINMLKVLNLLGCSLGWNVPLLRRVIKTVANPNFDHSLRSQIFGEFLLPALCIQKNEAPLDGELWKIAQMLDVSQRYSHYQLLWSRSYQTVLPLLNILVDMAPRAIKWTKHLSDEASRIKMMQAETAVLTSSGNTMILASQVMKVISSYNNLIRPLLLTLRSTDMSPLALDMFSYCVVRLLSDKQEQHKGVDSEGNPPMPLTYTAEFAAQFYQTFPMASLQPLLHYISNRLKEKASYESLVLPGILQAMSGWRDLEISELNDRQMIGLAGGHLLKIDIERQLEAYRSAKTSRTALVRLMNAKENSELLWSLLVNLGRAAAQINDEQEGDIQMLQNFFDRLHALFLQTLDVVTSLANVQRIIQGVPAIQQSELPLQYQLCLLRHRFKPIYELNEQQFAELVTAYQSTFDTFAEKRRQQAATVE